VTLEQAQAEMDVIGQRLANAYPDSNKGWGVAVDRLADVLIGPELPPPSRSCSPPRVRVADRLRQPGESRACTRISREGEMAVRAALGASRWRLSTTVADRERRDLCRAVASWESGWLRDDEMDPIVDSS
jgi:hypothetical protein